MKVSDNRPQKPPARPPVRQGGAAVKRKKKLSPAAILIIAIASVLVLCVAVLGFLVWRKYNNIDQAISNANSLYPTAASSVGSASGSSQSQSSEPEIITGDPEELDPTTGVVPEFNELKSTNEDTIGHIRIPDTKLETPVVQYTDNEYYLHRNFFGESALGVPFVDFRATVTQEKMSNNLVIYGHSASNGSYFAALKNYRTVDFYQKHPLVYFDTIYGKGVYKIIGAFVASVDPTQVPAGDPGLFYYHDMLDLDSEEIFNYYLDEVAKRSYFQTGVDVAFGDQLLTLSTCDDEIDSSVGTPYRMVVVARKVRPGESTEVDTAAATPNTGMVMPQKWVEKMGKANPYQ